MRCMKIDRKLWIALGLAVVITGCATLASARDGIRYGICDYLQKPFDVVQVTAAVSRAVKRGASRRDLVAFLEELGSVVGRDRDTQRLLAEIQHSQKMAKALERAKKSVEYIEYEDVEHSILRNGYRVDMLDRIGSFLDAHIGQPTAAP